MKPRAMSRSLIFLRASLYLKLVARSLVLLFVPEGLQAQQDQMKEGSSSAAVVRFVVLGDMGTGKKGQYTVAQGMAQVCAQKPCQFALGLGDNIYGAGVSSVDDPQWQQKFEAPYQGLNFPFYMVLGNHDNSFKYGVGTVNDKGEFQVAYSRKKGRLSSRWQMPSRFYRFSFPDYINEPSSQPLIDFYGLDSNPLAGIEDMNPKYRQLPYLRRQGKWLQQALASGLGTWKNCVCSSPLSIEWSTRQRR